MSRFRCLLTPRLSGNILYTLFKVTVIMVASVEASVTFMKSI